jgi:hypothetical protein
MYPFRNKASLYGEELLEPPPTPKLEDHTVTAYSIILEFIDINIYIKQ